MTVTLSHLYSKCPVSLDWVRWGGAITFTGTSHTGWQLACDDDDDDDDDEHVVNDVDDFVDVVDDYNGNQCTSYVHKLLKLMVMRSW